MYILVMPKLHWLEQSLSKKRAKWIVRAESLAHCTCYVDAKPVLICMLASFIKSQRESL